MMTAKQIEVRSEARKVRAEIRRIKARRQELRKIPEFSLALNGRSDNETAMAAVAEDFDLYLRLPESER
jgi:hypothetical protein